MVVFHPPHRWFLFITLWLCITISSRAQKEANIWYFSDYGLDFNTGEPSLIFDAAPHESRVMGVMSDAEGHLLMYSDGFSIWNRMHEKMPNGADILPLHGASSFQATVIIPRPETEGVYYVITSDPSNGQSSQGLYYSVVDMSLDGGKGDVTQRAVKLAEYTTNKMGAVFHENGKDVWLMVQQERPDNHYLTYRVTKDGFQLPIKNIISSEANTFGGQFKFSPDGRMGAACYSDIDRGFDLFDFNSSTGLVSNVRHVPISYYSYAMSFSSDATKLYVSRYNGGEHVLQYDVTTSTEDALRSSETPVFNINYNSFYWFQLGPTGKIYITKGGGGGGTGHIGVINNPNASGKASGVVENQIYLEGRSSFVVWGPLFIENYFFRTDVSIKNLCLYDITELKLTNYSFADRIEWDLGDGTLLTADSVDHVYAEAGSYDVTIRITYGSRIETINRTITINPLPQFTLGADREVCDGFVLEPDVVHESQFWSDESNGSHIKPHVSGRYSLVQSNLFGCIFTDSVELLVHPTSFVALPNDTLMCAGQPMLLKSKIITGNPGYTWNTGSTEESIYADKTGFYWLKTTTEFGCTDVDSVYLVAQPSPVVSLGSDTTLYRDSYLTLDPGTFGAGTTFVWDDFSTGPMRNVHGSWYSGTKVFYVTVKTAYGCTGTDDITIEFLNVTGIEDGSAEALNIYPIPTRDALHVEVSGEPFDVHVFDMTGRLVHRQRLSPPDAVLDANTLPRGLYRLVLSRNGDLLANKTIIIE